MASRKKPKRPPWDPETITRVVTKIGMGVDPLVAALSEEIPQSDWDDWLKRGQAGEKPYDELRHQVELAGYNAEVLIIGRIQASAREGVWGAAAWLAERRWPERYARKSIVGKDAPRNDELPPGAIDPFADLDNVALLRPKAER